MKAQLGDFIWLYKRRRVIVRIQRCEHGGHCYYGVRLLTRAAWQFIHAHNLVNLGFDGLRRRETRIYWIRSDRLTLFDGEALHTGRPGRPQLEYRRGRNRADESKS
jgi:hypothetical protein